MVEEIQILELLNCGINLINFVNHADVTLLGAIENDFWARTLILIYSNSETTTKQLPFEKWEVVTW